MNYPKFNYRMSMPTPWGKADHVERRGDFLFVSTPSHGGIMIGKEKARRNLTESARRLGMMSGAFLCYEEDCLAAIPQFECPEEFFSMYQKTESPAAMRKSAVETIKRWNPEYFDLLESEYRARPESRERIKELLSFHVSSFVDDHIKVLAVGEASAKVSAAVSKAMADVFKTL